MVDQSSDTPNATMTAFKVNHDPAAAKALSGYENRLDVLESPQSLGTQFAAHARVLDSAVRRSDVGQIMVDPNGARVDAGGHRYGMVAVG
jgi:hypothetical protein